jgi:hypothetical protein
VRKNIETIANCLNQRKKSRIRRNLLLAGLRCRRKPERTVLYAKRPRLIAHRRSKSTLNETANTGGDLDTSVAYVLRLVYVVRHPAVPIRDLASAILSYPIRKILSRSRGSSPEIYFSRILRHKASSSFSAGNPSGWTSILSSRRSISHSRTKNRIRWCVARALRPKTR